MTSLRYEDPSTKLPHKPVQEYAKNRIIYDVQNPAANLYLVILGRVKIVTTSNDGGQTVCRIVRREGLFGESSLIGPLSRIESAIALDNIAVMSWSRKEIEQQVERDPRLGIALAQYLVRQCLELQDPHREHGRPQDAGARDAGVIATRRRSRRADARWLFKRCLAHSPNHCRIRRDFASKS